MDLKGQTQLSIDVDKTTAYQCEECGSEFFEEIICIRKISRLLMINLMKIGKNMRNYLRRLKICIKNKLQMKK